MSNTQPKFEWTDEMVLLLCDLCHHNGWHKFDKRVVDEFDEFKSIPCHKRMIPEWIKKHVQPQQSKSTTPSEVLPEQPERIKVGKMSCSEGEQGYGEMKWNLNFKTNKHIHYDNAVKLCNILEQVLNNDTPDNQSKDGKCVCRVQVGMIIRYKVGKRPGFSATVCSFNMQENKVWLNDGEQFRIDSFLDNIDNGAFKVEYYPIPLPEKSDTGKDSKVVTDNSDVACLSLNDVKEFVGRYYSCYALEMLEQKVNEKLKNNARS